MRGRFLINNVVFDGYLLVSLDKQRAGMIHSKLNVNLLVTYGEVLQCL